MQQKSWTDIILKGKIGDVSASAHPFGLVTSQDQTEEIMGKLGTQGIVHKNYDDICFRILQNTRRRHMIDYLTSYNGNLNLDALVKHLTEVEKDNSTAKNLRRSIKISIIQTHLPVLEKAGIVSFDPHTKEIQLLKIPENVSVYMNLLDKKDISWKMYYMILSSVGVIGSLAISQWIAISALVGVALGALMQRKGKLKIKI